MGLAGMGQVVSCLPLFFQLRLGQRAFPKSGWQGRHLGGGRRAAERGRLRNGPVSTRWVGIPLMGDNESLQHPLETNLVLSTVVF